MYLPVHAATMPKVNTRLVRRTLLPSFRRQPLLQKKRLVTNKAMGGDWMEVSYFVGKSVILFTMFYSGLNWLHYKKVREDNEKKK